MTEAGWLLNDFLEQSEREFQRTLEEIHRLSSNAGRVLKIGCPETWNPHYPTELLRSLLADHPEVQYTVESYRLSELLSRLSSGTFDIIITHEFYAASPLGPSSCPVAATGCGMLYSPEQFPGVTSPAELKELPFLVYDDDVSKLSKRFSGVIRECCAEFGFRPRFRSTNQASAALFDTSSGKGVMFFSDWDSPVTNPIYGYLSLNRQLPVNIIYYPDKLTAEANILLKEAKKNRQKAE